MNFTILGKSYAPNPTLNLVLNSFQDLVFLKDRFRNPKIRDRQFRNEGVLLFK